MVWVALTNMHKTTGELVLTADKKYSWYMQQQLEMCSCQKLKDMSHVLLTSVSQWKRRQRQLSLTARRNDLVMHDAAGIVSQCIMS